MGLLKTCNTCFHGKIRCDRTQNFGPCDRCLRLGKECVFPPRRQNHKPQARNARVADRQPSAERAQGTSAFVDLPSASITDSQLPSQPPISNDFNDPLAQVRSWLDVEREGQLFDVFRTRICPRFPFVTLPESITPEDMHQQRPCTYLAILAVASSADFVLQRKLSGLFNRVLAARTAAGKLASLDVLQGLLLHLAWAHHQPRPRSYTQQLHLATSIVSDLRLDRPRKQQLWNVDKSNEVVSAEWSSDELRATIGTYYLASCSSVVLQKMHPFPYTGFILESCQRLEQRGEYPSDNYLRHIVQHQRLAEELETTVGNVNSSAETINASFRDRMDSFKSDITFSLSDCPILGLQLNVLELLTRQQSLPHLTLGAIQQSAGDNQQPIMDSLSECIMASKSVLGALLAMPAGSEQFLSNLEWVVFSWSLSFSARLDVLASGPCMAHLMQRLRRRLDFRHTLRQVLLRLESLVAPQEDGTGDRDVFYHFLKRARGVEAWYLRHTGLESLSTPGGIDASPSQVGSASCGAEIDRTLTANASQSGLVDSPNLSFSDYFPQEMLDVDFGMFLGMQDSDLF